ncbi:MULTISPECIES: cyclase family protein [unclassified Streptomyces]|uniref:cyclase family protein n=1 Tax=unclassified Streptomyces TaxID=2593676 RepID=UPI0035DBD08D
MTAPEPRPSSPVPSNWGRWGSDDERGTLNHITGEVRARAVGQAQLGQVVSLARPAIPTPLTSGPVAPLPALAPAAISQAMTFTGSPSGALTDLLIINTHHPALTHLDALGHIPQQGQVYPGHDLSTVATSHGLKHSSTTAFAGGILTRGVLLDLAPEGGLPPGHPITAADLDHAAERAEIAVAPGDGLVVRGGWSAAENLGHRPTPGMTLDAIRWLDHHRISLYLGDVGDAHPPVEPDPAWPLPLHQVGLARLGLPLVDNAAVDDLAHTCRTLNRTSFLLVLAPPAIHGATGVPVTPLAVF